MNLLDARPIPSRILGTIRTAIAVEAEGDLTRERLEALVAPPSIRKDDIATTINACIDLGVLLKREGNLLAVAPEFSAKHARPLADLTETLVDHVLRRLSEDNLDTQFCRTLAWLLMQPAAEFPISSAKAEILWNEQDPSREALGLNDVRFISFAHWARFLGFVWWQSLGASMAIHPDPTRCFERNIMFWMRGLEERRMPIGELLRRAEMDCPWLENGEIANETRMELAAPPAKEERTVNASTALALSRLEKKGRVQFLRLSDAVAPLTLKWCGSERVISHIELKVMS